MSRDPFTSIRTTQRVPRSCTACTSRKVKCDKSMPCGTCIRRGHPETCMRELVIVRGEVTTFVEAPQMPTYEELRCENERMRHEIEQLKAQNSRTIAKLSPSKASRTTYDETLSQPPQTQRIDQDVDGLERRLWDNLASSLPARRSIVSRWSDIALPSKECSEHLIDYDERWNSWVHYALEYPQFRHECESFTAAISNGTPLEQADPSWMAVYFSVISVLP
jgi:hypothetical protein